MNPLVTRFNFFSLAAAFLLLAQCATTASAQDLGNQRMFSVSQADAKAAIQKASATSRGRLPILEGFIQPGEQPTERYDQGYYECTFQLTLAPNGQTMIKATAKITAWYKDSDPSRSGYRVLPSNGRLEADALDRIGEILGPNASAAAALRSSPTSAPPSSSPRPTVASLTPRITSQPKYWVPSGANLESVKAMRVEDEKKGQELAAYIKNLEEIQRNQSHPTDLAAVKRSKTPVLAKPADSAQVLLNADAQDEFQVLGVDGLWVHVQISGLSRGWIRRSQLEMPVGFSQAQSAASSTPSDSAAIFKVTREQTGQFSGTWTPLKGRLVRIEWVEPSNPATATSRQQKLAFAKAVFLRTSQNLPASQNVEGIVVVFDSADGGQIAAAMPTINALVNHAVTDSAFWKQCSLDPTDSFVDSTRQ